ncbi:MULTISPECIES: fimbrial protein [Providencia]|uniref:Fimbrial protein n=1 Tax=Providencia heimbachae ATCC 35613 TaxID=1354272 RepID=A0A1B7JSY2_9GAMM|nr:MULTISPECIES: fimbrial protein [Providencia]MBP6122413.1 type 1 fimbrial protein [Providencia sp.]NIH20946.1 type 1 fimbrial protein [Providencia heimbachae]OAT51013.1 fimbrial protein [Providencia heimbachae ATCC 35613]QCJ68572.1 type 1 fimbrial protein [Providencia heimbachae]SQH11580.1 putative fimbrial protein SthA [Providencia heimbachae]
MNNTFALSAATALILSASSVLAADNSAGGVINFSGAITDTTCTINGGKSADFTVALNPITVTEAGTKTGLIDKNKKTISLTFSDCAPAAKVADTPLTIRFSSADNISTDGNYLQNTTVNENDQAVARNVGFAIAKSGTNTALPLNKPFVTDIKGNKTNPAEPETLALDIYYYKTNAQPAKVGSLSSNVTYTISYL